MPSLTVRRESWPIRGSFTISRGSKTSADVIVVELSEDGATGRGECVPYPHYDETVQSVVERIESLRQRLASGVNRAELAALLPAGAARNALDCALWDLEAKLSNRPVWELAGMAPPAALVTAYTLSLDSVENTARAAREQAWRPVLKLKLGGERDLERVAAVREHAPDASIIVDANEGWTVDQYTDLSPRLAELGVDLIEQPLPAGNDGALASLPRAVPVCADESCRDMATMDRLVGLYDAVNIKLDKAGGLTESLRMLDGAEARGLDVMVGCMIGTSLAMAPALLVAQRARFVDLDGPLLLERDRGDGLRYEGSTVFPPDPGFWG